MLAGTTHLSRIAREAQWDEAAIDLTVDAAAFGALAPSVREQISALVSGFRLAEEAVAEHLDPYVAAAQDDETRALLTLQQADEGRHARFFARVDAEVCRDSGAASRPALAQLFRAELPAAAAGLAAGDVGLAGAVALYHLVLEGLVLGIGQEALLDASAGVLPGVHVGCARVQRDERWHVGLGITCLAALGGTPPPSDALVALALDAWGPGVATPERVARTRQLHARRVCETAPR